MQRNGVMRLVHGELSQKRQHIILWWTFCKHESSTGSERQRTFSMAMMPAAATSESVRVDLPARHGSNYIIPLLQSVAASSSAFRRTQAGPDTSSGSKCTYCKRCVHR